MTKDKYPHLRMHLFIFIGQVILIGWLMYSIDPNMLNASHTLRKVNRNSNSMSPLLDTNAYWYTMTYNEYVGPDDYLWQGKIYVYTKDDVNGTRYIAHRLVAVCEPNDERQYIFKGDNNLIADDPVNRSQVKEKIVGASFE